jgi:hypothetical protein
MNSPAARPGRAALDHSIQQLTLAPGRVSLERTDLTIEFHDATLKPKTKQERGG